MIEMEPKTLIVSQQGLNKVGLVNYMYKQTADVKDDFQMKLKLTVKMLFCLVIYISLLISKPYLGSHRL